MKKYGRFLATLLLFCNFMVSLNGMQSDVKDALRELRRRLDDLRFGLEGSQPGLQLKDLPVEIVEKMLFDGIPTFKGTTPAEVAKIFLDTVRSLRNFSKTNTAYYSIFLDPIFKRAVVRKLFDGLSFAMLQNIPMPNKMTADESVFGDIANALYYMRGLHNNLIRDIGFPEVYRDTVINDKLQKLVSIDISPNFFIDERNLFHIALQIDSLQTVKDMIAKGADVTMPTKEYKAGRLVASSPVIILNYNQIPFVLAFSYSPESALYLLNQKLVDKNAIEKNLSHAWAYYRIYNDPAAVRHHVQYYVQLVKKLIENDIDVNTAIVVTVARNFAIKNSFLALFLSYYDRYGDDEKVLEIIRFLLDNKAKINQPYYMVDWAQHYTPLAFARAQKGSFPELYALIEKYKDNPDNN